MIGVKGTLQEAEAIKEKVGNMLAGIGLELSPKKTKITNINSEKATFLGTDIIRAKEYTYARPSNNHHLKRNSRKLRFLAPIDRIEKRLKEAGFMKKGNSHPKFV
jgi:hypothetical protein